MFSFPKFFDQQRISYITSGKNVARGHINIKCPFCSDDPSEHLGINIENGYWSCWRNREHSGKRPHRLISKLLGWSFSKIDEMLGVGSDPNDLTKVLRKFNSPSLQHTPIKTEVDNWPKHAKLISPDTWLYPYWKYLLNRGFDKDSLAACIDRYQLHASLNPDWMNRVLIPIFGPDSKLAAFTGRHIGHSTLRYKSTATFNGTPIKQTLWRWDEITQGKILVLTEGPIDAIKVDWYGKEFGVRGSCVFGSYCSYEQELILRTLCKNQYIIAAFDKANFSGSLKTQRQLAGLHVLTKDIPEEDLGACSPEQIRLWSQKLINLV